MNLFTPPSRYLTPNADSAVAASGISETPVRSGSQNRNIIPKKIFKKVAITQEGGKSKKGRKPAVMFVACDKYCPVPLPEAIVDLFRKPHVFPDIAAEEFVKKTGFSPRIILETPLSKALFSANANLSESRILKLLKKRASTDPVKTDPELLEIAGRFMSTVTAAEERVIQINSETFRFRYRNSVVKFNPVRVLITRIRPSVLKFYQSG